MHPANFYSFHYAANRRDAREPRQGKILVSLAILLPTLLAFVGLVFDGGRLATDQWVQQHATDSAAMAAANQLQLGITGQLHSVADRIVCLDHDLPTANVSINRPPASGSYQGNANYVEVIVDTTYHTSFMGLFAGQREYTMTTRSVAGCDAVTPGAALVALDPDPETLSVADLPSLLQSLGHLSVRNLAINQYELGSLLSAVPLLSGIVEALLQNELLDATLTVVAQTLDQVVQNLAPLHLPALTAGLEVEGLGCLQVEGSVHVNNEWGGVDERGDPVGENPHYPHAVACMPLLSTTRLKAEHIRVAGGVDRRSCYQPLDSGDASPLQANRSPVPDPLEGLPSPLSFGTPSNSHPDADIVGITLSVSGAQDVLDEVTAGLTSLLRPLLAPLRAPLEQTLAQTVYSPGVYRSITVVAPTGGVRFEPGVYVITGKNPVTEISLCLLGPVQAEGVMFYITPSATFDGSGNLIGEDMTGSEPPPNLVSTILPSVVIAPLLPGGKLTGLNHPSSPYHEMLIYQHPSDRRPMLLECQQLIGNNDLSGTIYAKWGHVSLVGANSRYDLKIAAGTIRFVTLGQTTLAPSSPFPAARDVVLVE
ncbi:pilus assembly protein TadG-related protein [Rhodopirellula sp. JC740]|uniref:Pilus assembly protein TadG-related protein n=1 Tax=Rhodopirellula halodulae TaxID=2894198 RepID=A0ABS8NKT5_9BACT|nr:pilus assembly protein TadG-related protein [Rhodopirellula sp. JC740]MCC9643091.1 pilus assembly protein TadG-related protein [Rhodopirellula sp. JC740]